MTERLITLCKELQLSLMASSVTTACEQAERQQRSYVEFLTDLLAQENDARLQRRAKRRVKEARFPQVKTLESFDFAKASNLPETRIRSLAQGEYINKAEPIIFVGEPGTGKTHLATALGYCAAQEGICVRFTTVSQLANLLVEARDHQQLSSLSQRFQRYNLLILDELGYLPLAKTDAELLFQILSLRHEKYPVIITTNLPFSEWTSVFTDHRLCKALIDRITHRAHIIETGKNSVRLEQTIACLHKMNNKGGDMTMK
jgi:DNA replication protein DnaC